MTRALRPSLLPVGPFLGSSLVHPVWESAGRRLSCGSRISAGLIALQSLAKGFPPKSVTRKHFLRPTKALWCRVKLNNVMVGSNCLLTIHLDVASDLSTKCLFKQ